MLRAGTGRTASTDLRRSSASRGIVGVEGIAKIKGPSSLSLLQMAHIPKLRVSCKGCSGDSMRSWRSL